jgi:hypothetical protein
LYSHSYSDARLVHQNYGSAPSGSPILPCLPNDLIDSSFYLVVIHLRTQDLVLLPSLWRNYVVLRLFALLPIRIDQKFDASCYLLQAGFLASILMLGRI